MTAGVILILRQGLSAKKNERLRRASHNNSVPPVLYKGALGF